MLSKELEKGQAMVEFILPLILTLFMIMGFLDLAFVFAPWNAGQNASAEGARAAALWKPRVGGTYSCEQAVIDAISVSTPYEFTIAVSGNCEGNFTQPIPRNEEVWVETTMIREPLFYGTFLPGLELPFPREITIRGYQKANHW